jgi:hypothetical protein
MKPRYTNQDLQQSLYSCPLIQKKYIHGSIWIVTSILKEIRMFKLFFFHVIQIKSASIHRKHRAFSDNLLKELTVATSELTLQTCVSCRDGGRGTGDGVGEKYHRGGWSPVTERLSGRRRRGRCGVVFASVRAQGQRE